MKLAPTKVILQIVYSEEEITDELKEYKKELERYSLNSQYFVVPLLKQQLNVAKIVMFMSLVAH
jgi:hypothetical protein